MFTKSDRNGVSFWSNYGRGSEYSFGTYLVDNPHGHKTCSCAEDHPTNLKIHLKIPDRMIYK